MYKHACKVIYLSPYLFENLTFLKNALFDAKCRFMIKRERLFYAKWVVIGHS